MLTHEQLTRKMLSNPEVNAEYEVLKEEFNFFDALLRARKNAGLTQSEVAEIMGTKTPAIARLEAGGGSKKHSPSIQTLQKYAKATGCRLEIKLVQNNLNA